MPLVGLAADGLGTFPKKIEEESAGFQGLKLSIIGAVEEISLPMKLTIAMKRGKDDNEIIGNLETIKAIMLVSSADISDKHANNPLENELTSLVFKRPIRKSLGSNINTDEKTSLIPEPMIGIYCTSILRAREPTSIEGESESMEDRIATNFYKNMTDISSLLLGQHKKGHHEDMEMKNFRSICLLNVCYKIITKKKQDGIILKIDFEKVLIGPIFLTHKGEYKYERVFFALSIGAKVTKPTLLMIQS
ncbi:hypothetical protein ACJX0J_018626 [Zea mays]